MKRMTLWALSLVLVGGLFASTASAFESVLQEKTVYEGTPRRPGGGGRRPHYRPGHGGSHGGYYRRRGNDGLGFAIGAAVGTALGAGIANSNRYSYSQPYSYSYSQPTLICDAYGNCYYR